MQYLYLKIDILESELSKWELPEEVYLQQKISTINMTYISDT